MTFDPIRKRRVYEEVFDRIGERIRSGSLREGDTLPSERELMESFGVGRPAIREALLSLQKAGLVMLGNGERAKVSRPDAEHFIGELSSAARVYLSTSEGVRNFQDARVHLEVSLVRHAAKAATKADLARISGALERNRKDLGDLDAFERSDIDFHYEIAQVARNPLFNGLHQAIVAWLQEQRSVSLTIKRAKTEAFAFHERIFAEIERQNADAAEAAMREHLSSVADFYWNADTKGAR